MKTVVLSLVAVALIVATVGIPSAFSRAAEYDYTVDHIVAADNLNRTTTGGWGSAQIGGKYALSLAAPFTSNGSSGVVTLPRSGSSLTAALTSVSSGDTRASTVVILRKIPSKGSGLYAGLQVRSTGGSYYQAQLRMTPTGSGVLSVLRINGSTAHQVVVLGDKTVVKNLVVGSKISLEFQVTGTSPVILSARAWSTGSSKPDWQLAGQDQSPLSLTRAGAVGVWSYVSSSTPALSVGYDDLAAYALKSTSVADPVTPAPTIPPTTPPSTPPTTAPPVTTPGTPTPPPAGFDPSDPGTPVDSSGARGTVGSAPIGSTAYAVPPGALFVATTGFDGAAGTQDSPLGTVQAAIDRATSGSTIVLRGGTYHEGIVLPKGKALTVQSYPNEEVWLDGSRVVDNWTHSGSAWVSTGWTTKFDSSPTYTRGAPDNTADAWSFVNPAHPMAAHPDQVWMDSAPLEQVGSQAQVTAGTFFVDTAGERLYIGSDPSGRAVRASDLVKAATVLGDGSVLRGIGIRRFAPSVPDMGAVVVYARNAVLENVAITDNATTGLSLDASGITVRNVTTARNGMLGTHANYADGLRVVGLLSSGNNTESFNRAPVSGGFKVTRSRGIAVSGSAFLNNAGNALWFDESVYDATVVGTDIVGNTGNGLVFELSSKLVFANNVVAGNGLSGALVSDSNQADVWNNTFTGNARNVNIVQGDRRASNLAAPGHDPRQNLPDPTVTWITGQVTVKNNVLANSTFKCNLCVEDYSHQQSAAHMQIVTDGNVYQRTTTSAPVWAIVWSRGAGDPAVYSSVNDFITATGQDVHSLVLEGKPALSSTYAAVLGVVSATQDVARPLPAFIAALVGKPAGSVQLGAWVG